jgi:hypothetical protein
MHHNVATADDVVTMLCQVWRVKPPSAVAALEAASTSLGQVLQMTTMAMWTMETTMTSFAVDPIGKQVCMAFFGQH